MKKFVRNPIRILARSNYWQTLYVRAKELSSLKLFNNETDLTFFQIIFLQWLEIYHSLYVDLSSDNKYLTENIIKDEIRADAYLYYRKKRRENKLFDKQERKAENRKEAPGKIPSVTFKKRYKK
jgi:hypothetical protein